MQRSEIVSLLLKKRGLEAEHEIQAFLSPDYELHTHSPFLFADMDAAVDRLFTAIEKRERIAVYSDFDCDGIPGAALLYDFFQKIGHENLEIYIPHRDKEGYGVHQDAIDALASRGVSLVITVDVGTNAVEAIRYAKQRGIDVIVTDHHEIGEVLPDAVAILNPKRNPYPFPDLCGAAVAFKFVQAAIIRGKERTFGRFVSVNAGWEKWLLDLVAIATVADMVPLVGENRVLAHWGLAVLRKSPRPGISSLCQQLRLRKAELTEDDIGFSIAPRINAASRMDNPDLAFQLLTTKSSNEADILAANLEKLNTSRKSVVSRMVREAKKRVRERFHGGDVVVLGDPEWKPALLGLAANSVMEERGGVVCLWGRDAGGKIKGSCRSDGTISVVELLREAKEAFSEAGGHAASGGFTVVDGAVHTLPEVLAKATENIAKTQREEDRAHDALIALREVSFPLYKDISQLSPFGIGNPKPIFRIPRLRVSQVRCFGKDSNHVEVMFHCVDTSVSTRAFDFFRSPVDFTASLVEGMEASALVTIERDTFRGGLALRLIDILEQ